MFTYMYTIRKFNSFGLKKAIIVLIIAVLAFNLPIRGAGAFWGYEDILAFISNKPQIQHGLFIITGGDSLMCVNQSLQPKVIKVILTGYSSTPDQTDDTPFITASNTYVRDGIVAANFLAFGTKVQIPSLFGDKVFTVEDRMARKHNDKMDIWFPERYLAKNFGVKEAEVMILE